MTAKLVELPRLQPRRHMVAHATTVVALGFERVEERLAAIVGGRDLHEANQRGVAPVSSHAGGNLHPREKLLDQDGTRVPLAQPAASLGCGERVAAQRLPADALAGSLVV